MKATGTKPPAFASKLEAESLLIFGTHFEPNIEPSTLARQCILRSFSALLALSRLGVLSRDYFIVSGSAHFRFRSDEEAGGGETHFSYVADSRASLSAIRDGVRLTGFPPMQHTWVMLHDKGDTWAFDPSAHLQAEVARQVNGYQWEPRYVINSPLWLRIEGSSNSNESPAYYTPSRVHTAYVHGFLLSFAQDLTSDLLFHDEFGTRGIGAVTHSSTGFDAFLDSIAKES
jgi:hypothetical protein